MLVRELDRLEREAIFERRVFFIRTLGFITPTDARRISFDETLRFEGIHEKTYREFGFELVLIEAAGLLERVDRIKASVR